jgi:hypothetical protein
LLEPEPQPQAEQDATVSALTGVTEPIQIKDPKAPPHRNLDEK